MKTEEKENNGDINGLGLHLVPEVKKRSCQNWKEPPIETECCE